MCGHKTIYDKKYHLFSNDGVDDVKKAFAEFQKKSPLEVTLDYSTLCGYCNRHAKQRGIFLEFTYADGRKTKADIDDSYDFVLLQTLFEGKIAVTNGRDVSPLKSELSKLRKLLGLPKADDGKKE